VERSSGGAREGPCSFSGGERAKLPLERAPHPGAPEDRGAVRLRNGHRRRLTATQLRTGIRRYGDMGKYDSLQLTKRMNKEEPIAWLGEAPNLSTRNLKPAI
jgi:hypothetical protein